MHFTILLALWLLKCISTAKLYICGKLLQPIRPWDFGTVPSLVSQFVRSWKSVCVLTSDSRWFFNTLSWFLSQYSWCLNIQRVLGQCARFSDGSGPKTTGPGQARALKVGPEPGLGLSPSMNAGPRALMGLEILLCTVVKKLKFSGPSPKVGLRACSGLGPSSKVGLRAFQKTRAPGRA